MSDLLTYCPPTREAWRRWLEENHQSASEIWLVTFKKHTGKPTVSYDAAVEEALCFGWIDGVARRLDDERTMQRYTPRRAGSAWSQSNRERILQLIASGLVTEAGMACVPADVLAGAPAPARRGADEVPEYFEKALREHGQAWENFSRLAPSYRRDYIRWVDEAKREETKQRRLREAIERLARGERLGMK